MTRLVGLDVGTSSVKGIAIDEDGAVSHVAERGYPLSTPRPGWSEQDPEDWWRGRGRGARRAATPTDAPASGCPARCTASSRSTRATAPLRPAILWNDGRTQAQCDGDRGAHRPRAPRSQLTGNRALAGLHRAQAAVAARARAGDLRADRAHPAAEGLRPAAAVRASTRSTSPTPRGRCCSTSRGGGGATRSLDALEVDPAWLPQRARSRPTVAGRDPRRRAGRRRRGRPGGRRARRRRGRRGRPGVRRARARPASCSPRCDRYAADPEARVHAFCHAVPGAWHVMGVMLSAAGSLRWLRDTIGGDVAYDDAHRRGAERGSRASRACCSRRTWPASARRTPTPTRAAPSLGLGLRHDRGALARAVLEGVAFGLRDALDLVVELGGRPASGRVSGGGARAHAVARDRRVRARASRSSARARRRGRRLRRGAARRRRGGRVGRRARGRRHCVQVTRTIEPRPGWVERYAELQPAFRRVYPALVAARGG